MIMRYVRTCKFEHVELPILKLQQSIKSFVTMMLRPFLTLLALLAVPVLAFVTPPSTGTQRVSQDASFSSSQLQMAKLEPGDPIMLIGPGFLQLVLAKTLKAAGYKPIVVAPQTKLDSFKNIIVDDEIMKDGTIGMPEVGEPYFGEIASIIFCSEEAVLPASVISTVLDYTDQGKSAFCKGGLKEVVCCAPVSNKVIKEKSMGWIPLLNNSDEQTAKVWKALVDAYVKHPKSGPLIRYGSLFGGSYDGPDFLRETGLDEGIYKMTLEQYRDMRERAFDRYKLGVQLLEGDSINPQPPNQERMEKEGIKDGEAREIFRIVGGYPEIDRVNRHCVAQTVLQVLQRDEVPDEFTVLSKGFSEFPSEEEWDELFAKMEPAKWPDPYAFEPAEYGLKV